MADNPNDKRERAKAVLQYEADAKAVLEKTARLRALRLAHEAANKEAAGAAGTVKRAAPKKKGGKSAGKAPSLSEWLATRQNEGRRN